MEEVINELLKEGDRIVIYFLNAVPFKGTFVKCTNGIIVALNKMERLTLMRIDDINRIQKADAEHHEEPVLHETQDDTPQPSDTDSDIFEIEQPALQSLRIVGKVNLDEVDPKRRERIRRLPANNGYEAEENIPDDNGIKIAPMGVISAIGPKFGFIDSNGETLYFNIGEVMKGWHNEPSFEKGDEVVFSRSENTRGIVAKCVHRPWTVSRQLRTIDNIAYRDQRNAKLLASQLTEAFPDDSSLRDTLYSMRML